MTWLAFRIRQIEVNRMDEPKNLLKCTCYLESLNKKREDTIESILKPRIATVNSCFDLFPCLRDPTRSSYPRVQFLAFSLDSNMSLSREAFYVVMSLASCIATFLVFLFLADQIFYRSYVSWQEFCLRSSASSFVDMLLL